MEGLMQLIKVNIRPRDLPEFFWHHLERDIELLGRSIGRSMDESAITLHLVLREILQKNPPTCEYFELIESQKKTSSKNKTKLVMACSTSQKKHCPSSVPSH